MEKPEKNEREEERAKENPKEECETGCPENISEDSGKEREACLKEEKERDLGAQLADMNDKYLRLYSDFDNYRKRVNREKLEMVKTASSNVVLALLPVIDDMERALKAFQDAVCGEVEAGTAKAQQALFEGVDLIYNKMMNVLKQQGVSECEVMGKAFDAELAEAVAQIPAPDDSSKGIVLDVVQKGYAIDNKVIRFAKVVVGC